jgi:hypothetical protein
VPMVAGSKPFDVEGVIGSSTQLSKWARPSDDAGVHRAAHHQRGELRRPQEGRHAADVRKVDLRRPSSRAWAQATRRPPKRSCATSAPAWATSCAMPRARRASSRTTCCPWTWAMASRCSCWACAKRRPSLPLPARAGR